jgi:peptide/nickel transport system permease protein
MEVREQIRAALGLGEPVIVRYFKWLQMMVVTEPLHMIAAATGWDIAPDGPRILSWQTRSPVGDIIVQRIPQTLWVVGLGYLFGILIALPIGVISAYRQYSWFDQVGTFVSMVGFSVPTFFTGVVFILIFSVWLGWFPSMYDTTLRVTDWDSFVRQVSRSSCRSRCWRCSTPARSAASCAPRCSTTSTRTMCAPPAPRACANRPW